MGMMELFLIAVGLSMDAFAVAVCKGLALRKVEPGADGLGGAVVWRLPGADAPGWATLWGCSLRSKSPPLTTGLPLRCWPSSAGI